MIACLYPAFHDQFAHSRSGSESGQSGSPSLHVYGTVSYMKDSVVPSPASTTSRFAALAKLSCPVSAAVSRGAGREQAICQAVVDLLNEESYESVTMDAVAAKAKASKATIYRRWSNKDDLVVDALRRVLVDHIDEIPDTGNLRDDLVSRLDCQVGNPQVFRTYKAAMKSLMHAAMRDPALAELIRQSFEDVQVRALQILLGRAHSRGELRFPVGAALAWELLHAHFSNRTTVEAKPVDAVYIRHVVDDLLMPVLLHAGSTASRDAVTR